MAHYLLSEYRMAKSGIEVMSIIHQSENIDTHFNN